MKPKGLSLCLSLSIYICVYIYIYIYNINMNMYVYIYIYTYIHIYICNHTRPSQSRFEESFPEKATLKAGQKLTSLSTSVVSIRKVPSGMPCTDRSQRLQEAHTFGVARFWDGSNDKYLKHSITNTSRYEYTKELQHRRAPDRSEVGDALQARARSEK